MLSMGETQRMRQYALLFLIWNDCVIHAEVQTLIWFSLIDVLSPSFGHCVDLHLNHYNKKHLINEEGGVPTNSID